MNRGFTAVAQIESKLNVKFDKELFKTLSNNPKLVFSPSGQSLRYKAHFDAIPNMKELRKHLKSHLEGVRMDQVADAYLGVEHDIGVLIEEKFVYKIDNPEYKTTNLYYRDPDFEIHVDDDIKELWLAVEMTNGTSITEVNRVLISFSRC